MCTTMEHPCHLEGMLDRDQRTAKLRFFESDSINNVPKYSSNQDKTVEDSTRGTCRCPGRTKSSSNRKTNSSHLSYRNGYLLNTFQRVKNLLVVVCLTLVTLPGAVSAPIMSQPKWINPCNLSMGTTGEVLSEITSEELSKITQTAQSALEDANKFKDRFASETFCKPIEGVHKDFKTQKLDWLSELNLPKSLGEEIPKDHLEKLKINEELVNVYKYLQMVAVGLEQVVEDQNGNEGMFVEEFKSAENHLQRVLCELQEVIVLHGLTMHPDVSRDIMDGTARNLDTFAKRKPRDWMIYREYMNTLEYIVEAFNHVAEMLKK